MFLSDNSSLNKAALIAIGLTAPTCVMAYTGNAAFNGYYGGLSGGVMQTDTAISSTTTSIYANVFTLNNQLTLTQPTTHLYKYSGTGALFLGFGHFFNNSNFYLAGEVFGDWAQRKNSLYNRTFHKVPDQESETLNTNIFVRLQNGEYGVDLRPGYLMDVNTLIYGRVGVAFNKMKNNMDTHFAYNNLTFFPTTTLNSSSSQLIRHNKAGLRLGVGVEHLITDRIAITADYIYTYYGKANTSGTANTLGEDVTFLTINGLSSQSSGRISNQSAMLGIKYYFFPLC